MNGRLNSETQVLNIITVANAAEDDIDQWVFGKSLRLGQAE